MKSSFEARPLVSRRDFVPQVSAPVAEAEAEAAPPERDLAAEALAEGVAAGRAQAEAEL